ncbi:MAG: hypothetical protein GX811_05630 [Lentisphaerae bacterium]|jgi:Tfp pilus assembly protein PilN|nr:hypothetical protein [Lentisphaerota bacterium]
MNLHINLILPSERRSGSNVSSKFLLQLVAVILPVLLLLLVLSLIIINKQTSSKLLALKSTWAQTEITQKTVQDIQQEMSASTNLVHDLTLWLDSKLETHVMLKELAEVIPVTAQLTMLTLNDNLVSISNTFQRAGVLFLRGKVTGKQPGEDISNLEKDLVTIKDIDTASVKRYEADPAQRAHTGLASDVKIFDIESLCRQRKLR